jgi:homopolymeric O-antigen transport system permease protein
VPSTHELVIEPRKGWQPVDFRELWTFRELLGFLVWRDIKIRYKQTLLGGMWAVLQPLIGMLVFGVLFNRVAKMPSNGVPYPLFVFTGLTIWSFFQNGVGLSAGSFIENKEMIRKIYFPRILVPFGQVAAMGFDLMISLTFLFLLAFYYHWHMGARLLWLPVFVLGSCLATAGFGFVLASLNVRYRDIRYALPFFTQMLLFITPVLYPINHVPAKLKFLLSMNPMAGMVEGFRYSILGGSLSWSLVGISFVTATALFVIGVFFIRRMEITFADVI